MNIEQNRKIFYDRLSELHRIGCIASLLGWDQQVYMPPKGAQSRADQLEYISVLYHARSLEPEYLRAVDELYEVRETLSLEDQVNVRETKRRVDIQRKLPEEFVIEQSQTAAMSYNTWVAARPANDFKAVQPYLEKLLELNKRFCELVGYQEHPYDALLDQHDPGITTSVVKPLLLDLAESLREIIPSISEKYGSGPGIKGHFPESAQIELCKRVAVDLGYDFQSGRIDSTAHPFMTTIGAGDVRITSRYYEDNFLRALYATIHETGHALYEMGLLPEHAGTPMGDAISSSIHESQSRIMENPVGRSREYCVYLSRILPDYFGDEAKSLDSDTLWKLVNRVKPGLIRIEADEVTYCQHIVIRMLLEELMLTDQLSVADLPDAWNEYYEKYLGIRPPDYKDGVMQDVHWHHGAMGYFPSYALGNLYNAMMMESAREALPDLSAQIEQGNFSSIRKWLRENVHLHGMRYRGGELIRNITGKDLSAKPFVEYLKAKFL